MIKLTGESDEKNNNNAVIGAIMKLDGVNKITETEK